MRWALKLRNQIKAVDLANCECPLSVVGLVVDDARLSCAHGAPQEQQP